MKVQTQKKEDYSYILINEDGDQVTFDLKDQSWEYTQEEDDPLNPGDIGSSQ